MQELDKAMEILDKLSFFGGQRAGSELWNDKPREVQDEDIASFNRDIEWLRDFIHKHMNDGWISVEKELPPNRKGAITMTENEALRILQNEVGILCCLIETDKKIIADFEIKDEELDEDEEENEEIAEISLKDNTERKEAFGMAITAIKEIQNYRKLGTLEELKTSEKEEDILKFYYCESEDDYYIGKRKENFYYARYGETGFEWFMSRYLPWGKHVIEPNTLWKEYTYPSEPKEISFFEWLSGFLKKYCGGTVEECMEAVEKQKPKTPDYEGDGYADGYMVYDTWICPNCGEKYELDYDDYKHCPNCGQAISLESEEKL